MMEDVMVTEASSSDEVTELERDESQFVTFVVEGEVFAAPMAPVQEIIRVPELARVPLAPSSLLGLANLRGRVLPIVDLRSIFGLGEVSHTDATRALVINLGSPLGFVVDRVASVISVNNEEIEPVSSIRSTLNNELLTGVVRTKDELVMVLDFAKLIANEFAGFTNGKQDINLGVSGDQPFVVGDDEEHETDELQLVSFTVDQQEYAAHIASVQEIVQMPERTVVVPNAPHHVLGLMTLRERLLPLVSLRAMLGLPSASDDVSQRVVVLGLAAGHAVGVVADTVDEVLRVPRDIVEPLPALLAFGSGIEEISSVCRLDGGKRLVSVIDTDRMFENPGFRAAISHVETMESDAMSGLGDMDDQSVEDEEQVVVFRLGSEEFGVPIASVQEIVRVPEALTRVPRAPSFVEGVINLRGAVLPVMDQRRRLGLEDAERNDRQRIMVYLLNGIRMGFIVDAVSEVLKIPRSLIETSPKLSGEQQRILGRVANIEAQKRMIMLVDPLALVSGTELDQLDRIA